MIANTAAALQALTADLLRRQDQSFFEHLYDFHWANLVLDDGSTIRVEVPKDKEWSEISNEDFSIVN